MMVIFLIISLQKHIAEVVECCSKECLEEVSAAYSNIEQVLVVKKCGLYLESQNLPQHRQNVFYVKC